MKYVFSFSLVLLCFASFSQTHTLQFYIQQASDNSPLLKDYQNQVLSNKLDSQILRATLKPQVNFISTNSYAPVINGWGYDEAITNVANVSALVQANRNFITKKNIAAQLRNIALQSRALLDTMQLSQKDLARTITEQFITAYGDMLTMDFNKEIFDLLSGEETVLKKLTEASVFKQTDYLNFYVTMQQQELTYLQSEIQYNTDYLTLNYLAGIVDTAIDHLEEPALADSMHPDFYHSVFIQRFVTDSLQLVNAKILIDYEYKPRLGAYVDGGFNSTLLHTPYKNVGFSAGASLTIPIYDGRQKQMKYGKIGLQERTRLTNKEFFINQYNQQIAMLHKQLYATDALIPKIKQQIDYANTLITANGQLLQTGDITMKDYILAINNYLNSRNLLTQNNVSRLRIINQINYWNR